MTKPRKIERSRLINTDFLDPNPWNPNKTSAKEQKAIAESLSTYSQVLDIIVRPHPDKKDRYQIIDGEHRYDEMSGEVYATVLHGLSDEDAKKLTIILNETRGRADKIELAGLLSDLNKTLDLDDLGVGLPYDLGDLQELITLADVEWDDFNENFAAEEETPTSEDPWTTLTIKVPTESMDVINQAKTLINDQKDLHKNEAIAWGMVLECLSAEYLAIPNLL